MINYSSVVVLSSIQTVESRNDEHKCVIIRKEVNKWVRMGVNRGNEGPLVNFRNFLAFKILMIKA